jgi:processive 1,2-diacylglycerol beta-glucosyltransferase
VFFEQLRNEDLYIVSSEYSCSRLLRQGIPEEKIRIFPFPVHRKFNPELVVSSDSAKKIGFDPDKKSVLISFGGQGVGSVEKFVRVLLRSGMKLNVVVVCGTNTTLFNRLTRLYEGRNTGALNILPLGFVENMNELTALSNCCFIKPGGSTTFEMLTMRKPVIFYQAAVHIEDANIRFAENAGVGRYAGRNVKKFVQAVRWYTAPEGIAAVKDAYDKLKLENGTKQIGDFLHRNFGEL